MRAYCLAVTLARTNLSITEADSAMREVYCSAVGPAAQEVVCVAELRIGAGALIRVVG